MEISWTRFRRFEGIKHPQKFERMWLSPLKVYYIAINPSDFTTCVLSLPTVNHKVNSRVIKYKINQINIRKNQFYVVIFVT